MYAECNLDDLHNVRKEKQGNNTEYMKSSYYEGRPSEADATVFRNLVNKKVQEI